MQAIVVSEPGGPEVLGIEALPEPEPAPGQLTVRVHVAGVNFIDTHQRAGRYPIKMPFTPGLEGAGVVVAVGEGSADVEVGDRVAWKLGRGSYGQIALVDAWQAVPIPEDISDDTAAAVMLQGCTAHAIINSVWSVGPGEWVLIHAGAGGVGHLATQMARIRGARVIATVSSEVKEEVALEAGADQVIRYDGDVDIAQVVRDVTEGVGVSAVYDGVGRATFDASVASLRIRGCLVVFGGASGPVENLAVERLNAGSLYLTRPTLGHYTRTSEELRARTRDLFSWLRDGRLAVRIGARYSLADAAEAHRALESRETVGKVLLEVE